MENAKVKLYKKDEIILREGEKSTVMYKILSGKAAQYFHYGEENEFLLGILSEQRCFGEIGMFTGKANQYTVAAISDVLVMRIDKDELSDFIVNNPKNALDIMTNMSNMIVNMGTNMRMVVNELAELVEKLPAEAENIIGVKPGAAEETDNEENSPAFRDDIHERIFQYKLLSLGGGL